MMVHHIAKEAKKMKNQKIYNEEAIENSRLVAKDTLLKEGVELTEDELEMLAQMIYDCNLREYGALRDCFPSQKWPWEEDHPLRTIQQIPEKVWRNYTSEDPDGYAALIKKLAE